MPFSFFKTVDTYGSMLNKLATANFFIGLLAFYFLTTQVTEVKQLAEQYTLDVSIAGLKVPAGYVLPPLFLALLFRAIKLHDRISDLFGIRKHYDWEYVIKPMLNSLSIDSISKSKAIENRSTIMGRCFYRYASSRDTSPVVDKHLIEMVLDQLTWYWMIIESSFILSVLGALLIYFNELEHVLVIIYIILGLIVFGKVLQLSCSKYTKQEVDIILDSVQRKREIREKFNEL